MIPTRRFLPHDPARRAHRRRFRPRCETVEARCLLSVGQAGAPSALVRLIGAGTVPLTDLGTGTYQGQIGGLYGGGSNVPPPSQALAATNAVSLIRPLNQAGRPSPGGRVVMLSIGQSTTSLIFSTFERVAAMLPDRSPSLTLVNGAQDGQVLQTWASQPGPFRVALQRLRGAGVSPRQVQVLFINLAEIYAWRYGGFSDRIVQYSGDLARVLQRLHAIFPNARLAFVSSRTYGGYGPQGTDPEPHAYESAFGVRLAIQRQMAGDPALNDDPNRGRVRSPVLLWGPYYWADGPNPSSSGLSYERSDFQADGVHPSASGSLKAAIVMAQFFATDPFARPWFLR